jgi:hypothetical protein
MSMLTKAIGLSIILALSSRDSAAAENKYITSFVGEQFALVFPAPHIPEGTAVYRDFRWAIQILSIKCDGKEVDPRDIGPVGQMPIVLNASPAGTMIYSRIVSDLTVCANTGDVSAHLLEYKIPPLPQTIEIRYRVRIPNVSVEADTNVVTAYLSHLFPTGKLGPEDSRRM